MPTCIACNTDKDDAEFRVRPDKNNWRNTRCRPCERVVQLGNYYKLKEADPIEWRVRIVRNNRSKQITREWLEKTLAEQGGLCALSGRPIDLMTCEIDHIQPETRGGSSDLSNLRLVCTRANEAKGNMTDDEFLSLCRDVLARSSAARSSQRKVLKANDE